MYSFNTKEVWTSKGEGFVFNVTLSKGLPKPELDTWVEQQVEINGKEYAVKGIKLFSKNGPHTKIGILV